MKLNQWTLGLAAAGVVSLASVAQADEAPSQVLTALSSTTISGYVDTSAIWNFHSENAGNSVPGRSFDGAGKQDGFNLNVVKLSIEKPLDEGQWSAGYKVDLLFGPDANTYNTLSAQSIAAGNADFGVKQAYVALRAPVGNGIDIKMGYWDTIIGYEVFEAGNNPNYSRSYGYFIEPTQHTGVLASYQVNDVVGLSAGVANTGNATINSRSGHDTLKSYLGSVTLTAPESTGFLAGSVLYLGIVDSGVTAADDVINYYAGLSVPTPLEGLSVGLAFDWRTDGVAAGSDETAIGAYASYQATEKLKLNGRVEYAEADGTGATIGGSGLTEVWGYTLTADYALWANVISRVEFRYDVAGDTASELFGTGTEDDVMSLALNVIYKF